MNRSLIFVFAALLSLVFHAPPGEAQTARARPGAGVHGLDLQLEGALAVERGGVLRLLATSFEVVGLSELRRAPGIDVQITSSDDVSSEPRVFTTDANGRALLELPIAADAPASLTVSVRAARSGPQGGVRRFELPVTVHDARELTVEVLSDRIVRGGEVPVFAQLRERGRGVADRTLRVELRSGDRPLGVEREVVTDALGTALFRLPVPRRVEGEVTVVVVTGQRAEQLESRAAVVVGDAPLPVGALRVAVAPEQWVVRPGEPVAFTVEVRNGEGRPIEGALLVLPPERFGAARRDVRTDRRGRARFQTMFPDAGVALTEQSVFVQASHEVEGSGSGVVRVRVSRGTHALALAIEGGALIPSLGGRVFARVVDALGRPAREGVAVTLRGPRLPEAHANTDAGGIATFDVGPIDLTQTVDDPCGGGASTRLELLSDGAEPLEACLALDPDATVRVRVASSEVRPNDPLPVEVVRTRLAEGLPVSMRVLDARSFAVLAATVLAPSARSWSPSLGAFRGEVLVVARTVVGTEGRECRGGSVRVRVEDPTPEDFELRVEPGPRGARVAVVGPSTGDAIVYALPADVAPLAMRSTPRGRFLEAELAVRTPRDVAAPFVLRAEGPLPQPAPTDAASTLLRDPWRAQSRFVTGRLALLFRAIEQQVSAAVPGRISDVAVESNGRWSFNAQILSALTDSGHLGSEGATGLGGEPITVEALAAFDPAFTYDNVARRVTRERLFRILVALRRLVLQQGYDLPWGRAGDPSLWLRHTTELYDETLGQLSARELVDGWGRPFVLAPARGRAAGWSPVTGWQVTSSGPDGRAGTADDLADPTARVLPTGSPYARAVGEELLLARLTGVELGRATVSMMSGFSGVGVPSIPESETDAAVSVAAAQWDAVPSPFEPPVEPLALVRVGRAARAGTVRLALGDQADLPLDDEPRTWAFVARFLGPSGTTATRVVHRRFGAPMLVEGKLPTRVRVDETIESTFFVTNLEDVDRTFVLEGGEDRIVATRPSHASVTVPAGSVTPVVVGVRGVGPGATQGMVRVGDGVRTLRTLTFPIGVDRGRLPLRTRSARLLVDSATLELETPSEGVDAVARLIALAPDALALDPDLSELRQTDPGPIAWALTVAGRPLDAPLRQALLERATGTFPSLSAATTLVALSARDESDLDAQRVAGELRGTLRPGFEPVASAAFVAALSQGGAFELSDLDEARLDPVAVAVSQHRAGLRRLLRTAANEPSLLARAAAALLLVDARDQHGRAMVERLRGHVEWFERGGRRVLRVVPSAQRDSAAERHVASLALALALHALGDDASARVLIEGVAVDDNLVVASGGELTFWWLASGVFGAMGSGEGAVQVEGSIQDELTLEHGRAVVALPAGHPSVRLRTARPVFVRAEQLEMVPFAVDDRGPCSLAIEGEPGDARHAARLELVVRTAEATADLTLLIQVPSGAETDGVLLSSLRASGADVEVRTPGLLRVRRGSVPAGAELRMPLQFVWSARGTVLGLGVVAYDAVRPERRTVLAPRTLVVQ